MKKAECERAIRDLCHEWAALRGVRIEAGDHPNFYDFLKWMRGNYPIYLKFRSTISVEYDAELWFDRELKQTWRR